MLLIFVTVRLNTFADDKSGEGSVEVEAITVEASNSPLKTIEVKKGSLIKPTLQKQLELFLVDVQWVQRKL